MAGQASLTASEQVLAQQGDVIVFATTPPPPPSSGQQLTLTVAQALAAREWVYLGEEPAAVQVEQARTLVVFTQGDDSITLNGAGRERPYPPMGRRLRPADVLDAEQIRALAEETSAATASR